MESVVGVAVGLAGAGLVQAAANIASKIIKGGIYFFIASS
jgi:hypothetical protein